MTLPRVTYDDETGYAYVYLAEPFLGISNTGVPLEPYDRDDPEALRQIVLDFDREGRLIGIEIMGPARAVLRPELIEAAAG
jgi:uncharacterized protein YuzE